MATKAKQTVVIEHENIPPPPPNARMKEFIKNFPEAEARRTTPVTDIRAALGFHNAHILSWSMLKPD